MNAIWFILVSIVTVIFLIYSLYQYYYIKDEKALHIVVISIASAVAIITTVLLGQTDAYDIPLSAVLISLGVIMIYMFREFYLAKKNGTLKTLIDKNNMNYPIKGKSVILWLAFGSIIPIMVVAIFAFFGTLSSNIFSQAFEHGVNFSYFFFFITIEPICMSLPAYLCQRFVKENS